MNVCTATYKLLPIFVVNPINCHGHGSRILCKQGIYKALNLTYMALPYILSYI